MSFHSRDSTSSLTATDYLLIHQAESTAKRVSVLGWYFVGFFLGVIGLLIVYLREPKISLIPATEYVGDEKLHFMEIFADALKEKQIKAT